MKKIGLGILIVCLVGLLIYSRVSNLGSGAHISEPDEWSYDIASKTLDATLIPKVAGRPLLEQSPLFEYLGYVINLVVKDDIEEKTFISIRLISVFSSFILAGLLFFYLHKKQGLFSAIASLGFFTLMPLTLFYSQLGLREMLLITTIFGFFVAYEHFSLKAFNMKWAFLSGLLLGLCVLVKTTAVVLVVIPAMFAALSLVKAVSLEILSQNRLDFRFKITQDFKPLRTYAVLILTFLGSVVLAFLPYAFAYPAFFKDRMYLTFFSHNSEGTLQKIKTMIYYLDHLDWWVTYPMLSLVLVGIAWIIIKKQSKWTHVFIFMLPLLFFLLGNEPRGRYFVLISPFLIILASLGLDYTAQYLQSRFHTGKVLIFTLILVVFGLMTPFSYLAYQSNQHTLIEQVTHYLRQYKADMVSSSFWPQVIQYKSGVPTYRFTDSMVDASRDHNELPEFSPMAHQPPTHALGAIDSIVIVHDPFDKDEFSERVRAVKMVENGFAPVLELTDNLPNFPEKTQPFVFLIYNIPKQSIQEVR